MLVTAKEAARLMGCHPATIRRWCRDGKIKSHSFYGKNLWFVDTAELQTKHLFLQANEPDATYTRLKALRAKAHKSILEVAGDLHMDTRTYRKYECNKVVIPSKVIVKLALYYGVTTDYLLCMDLHEKDIQNE
ncbi:MAG: helix-turn-helix domain-containing protein [Bacteroidales bacterium]|nr:helix-turn-helix domain-containing protein [Bacteroidales bacterium]